MQVNKLVKALVFALPMITLAACSSTQDTGSEAEAERRAAEERARQEQQAGVQTGTAQRQLSPEEERRERMAELRRENTIFFAFDDSNISSEYRQILQAHAEYLVSNPNVSVVIEGHTDERGTPEYNIALGERRANAVVNYLQNQGVLSSQMSTVSYGEEKPLVRRSNEQAWAQNRRAVLVY
ncbi:peptidoglycan-associated lipoprotein Pal [Aliidiomarina maris]|uniref:Peptidoglycan-associated lipoprotein n=1 Tax=Aliidiomarina maris TaxID=531312 RepID=A0A327X511_9GAMM|nr:peptidoglycan-associated lipoprotein Pal [Aliidiomarina maris]MCL5049627.1 peptidoglycan-associated lipoprotein Pal [Bacillota bacterium]RAK00799.1 peptidoglycan-associated lipoprotein [Aliidiomarina maris]RUO27208.1 peptidoglycan-associated lipoprotein [Aliidiomarina maris]